MAHENFASLFRHLMANVNIADHHALHRLLAAAGLDVSVTAVRHWVEGRRNPRLRHLDLLLDTVGCPDSLRDEAYRLHRLADGPPVVARPADPSVDAA